MKTIFDHIERIKQKPHHIRKRIAFGTAAAGTAVIALVWLVGNLSLGTFALKESSFADAVGTGGIEATGDVSQNLAGAAAALQDEDAPRIEIVDTSPSTQAAPKEEPTTIPF